MNSTRIEVSNEFLASLLPLLKAFSINVCGSFESDHEDSVILAVKGPFVPNCRRSEILISQDFSEGKSALNLTFRPIDEQ